MQGPLRRILIITAALIATAFIVGTDIWFETNIPKAVSVNIFSNKITEGESIHFLQISDVHGSKIATHKRIMKKISAFKPTAILITGDLVDKSTTSFSDIYKDIDELKKIAPIIFITGNHELANPEGEKFINGLRKMGMTVLRNSSITIQEANFAFNIAGIEDAHFGEVDINKALTGLDDSTFNILLSHTPAVALNIKDGDPIDLILSGHTHGGQVRLPFLGAIFLPDEEIPPTLVKGVSSAGEGITVYTDSGFGTSVIPVRFMNRSQVSLITITGAD